MNFDLNEIRALANCAFQKPYKSHSKTDLNGVFTQPQPRADTAALPDRRRYSPRSGLANDASLRKTRSQQGAHPVGVG
jgi:hypothetical protein